MSLKSIVIISVVILSVVIISIVIISIIVPIKTKTKANRMSVDVLPSEHVIR
jgi:hypothetical protein